MFIREGKQFRTLCDKRINFLMPNIRIKDNHNDEQVCERDM